MLSSDSRVCHHLRCFGTVVARLGYPLMVPQAQMIAAASQVFYLARAVARRLVRAGHVVKESIAMG